MRRVDMRRVDVRTTEDGASHELGRGGGGARYQTERVESRSHGYASHRAGPESSGPR